MKINDIFNKQLVGNTGNAERQQTVDERAPDRQQRDGDDRVSISSLSRQLSHVSDILSEDEEIQHARVASLKEQVQAGTFSVPSERVARAIIDYAQESKLP